MVRLSLFLLLSAVAIGALMPAERGGRPPSADRQPLVASEAGPQPTEVQAAVSGPWTTIERAPNGHFYTTAQVNGQSVDFLVDTGSSTVALTVDDARRLGIPVDPSRFEAIGSGASGPVYGSRVTLDRVTLDGKTAEQVEGTILQGSDVSLLGQSFLGRMDKIDIAPDRMTIR